MRVKNIMGKEWRKEQLSRHPVYSVVCGGVSPFTLVLYLYKVIQIGVLNITIFFPLPRNILIIICTYIYIS